MSRLEQLLEIAKRELAEEIKSGKRTLNEAKTFKVNPKYALFAVGTTDNKILSGWEIVGDMSSAKYYAPEDLKAMGYKKGDYKFASKEALKKQGIDPFNWNSWRPNAVDENVTVISTNNGQVDPSNKDYQDTIKKGDTVKFVKKGDTTSLGEAKKDKEEEVPAEEEAPEGEEQPVDTPPVDDQSSLSTKLGEHISAAIDAAADCIQNTEDKKYETTLGKVVKNLTAAQAALEDVAAHETKLAEEAGALRDKSLKKYVDAFKKKLKKVIKDDSLIEKIVKIYKAVIDKSHDKETPVEKMTEQVWKHFTLNESIQKKAGVMLNEGIEHAEQYTGSNPTLKSIKSDLHITKDGDNAKLKYKSGEDLPKEALDKLGLQFDVTKVGSEYKLVSKNVPNKKDLGAAFDKFKK